VTAIWRHDGTTWHILSPIGFPDEAALHGLVEDAPQLLPLSGSPQLVVLGREVRLGSGYADLVAVEPSGRLVIIEVKLARNAEARRAVVAQVLTYAAYLRGTAPESFERDVVGTQLGARGHASVLGAVVAADQEGSIDASAFADSLANSLQDGRFRLVLVLDEAPPELVRLVGYLESVAPELVIDLITVVAYQVGTDRLLVPQRVDPEREPTVEPGPGAPAKRKGQAFPGGDEFLAIIQEEPEARRPALMRMYEWAIGLEQDGLARLTSFRGAGGKKTLLPRITGEDAGLATIWADSGMSLWRSVFERRAPRSIAAVEELIAPDTLKKGTWVTDPSPELLRVLRSAYEEAAGRAPEPTAAG
jgi:hypothetical protein